MSGEEPADKLAAGTDSTMSESGVPTGPASTEQQPGQDLQAGPAQQAGESETVENVRALMQQLAAAATESAAPAVQPRRILTRTGAARRRASEATLMTSINQMELNTTWDNVHTHEESVRQMLRALEMDHHDYIQKEKLDINLEPEKSYINEFQAKVDRAFKKHRAKLQFTEDVVREPLLGGVEGTTAGQQHQPDEEQIRRLVDGLGVHKSASEVGSTTSRLSRGPALMHRIKGLQKKIQAKATAVERVLSHEGIEKNPRAVAKAGVHWSTIEVLRCEYQSALDEACECLGEEEIAEVLEEDEKQLDWMVTIEARLDELQILNISPAKGSEALANRGFIQETDKMEKPWEKMGMSMNEYILATEMANADNARKWEEDKAEKLRKDLEAMKKGSEDMDYRNFLQLQTQANMENERRLREQQEKTRSLEAEIEQLRLGGGRKERPVSDPKSAMRLPACAPPKFTGISIEYLTWKRTWTQTMGKSYVQEVQLMQLKTSIPARTAILIGLTEIRTMEDFWAQMDKEFLDYNALSRAAIQDIKSLDRKDNRFPQMMLTKLTMHKKNLEQSNMSHRVTSDDMIREQWLPMLPTMAKEDWLKTPVRIPPLWPHFETFLETQAEACRQRERLLFTGTDNQDTQKKCQKCKSSFHTTENCKRRYCETCRTYDCKCKRQSRGGNFTENYCNICNEKHPFEKHTKSVYERNHKGNPVAHKLHMQSASQCRRCIKDIRDSPQTCGACGQLGKPGEKLHCYDHCNEFLKAEPDERLKYVLKFGDCTLCLLRDHNTDSHMGRYAGKGEKAVTCSVWDKQTNSTCSSIQNVAFHGSSSHRQTNQKGFHTKAFPTDGQSHQGTGTATIRKEWEKAAKVSRKTEMEEASRLLLEPEVDGDEILLLVQEVTLVTGLERKQTKSSVFHDRGSTCSSDWGSGYNLG